MARDEKDYMTNPSLIQRVTSYITQGGRPEYQEATEHPKTLSVYNEPYAKQNGAALGTFEYYVDDAGRLTKGIADVGISDPFTKINSQIDMNVSLQAPKVKIDGNRVVVQAPKEILSSPLVSQIKEELRSLKGSDLKSAEVQNAINALNEEISTGLKDSLLNSATGWTREQYNNYQLNRQRVSKTNPMNSDDYIIGIKKDGEEAKMKFKDWVNYYREAYNTQERMDAFRKSFYSSDPYERTMALVMGQGNKTPVYGFDTAEKMGEGWKAFVNQMGKFPEGTLRFLAEDNDTRRLEGIVNNKRIPVESMRKFNVNTEDEFNARKESIKGKSWDELSDDDKAFVAILGVSREGELEKTADTTEAMKNYRGSKTNTFAWDTNQQDYERAERKAARQIGTEDLNNATSEDKEKSKDAIDRILSDNSFEKYRTARNNYDTWQGYQDWTEEGERELASTADWSGSEQWWGNLVGTIGRYLWENAVVQGATGGISAKSLANPNLIRGGKAGGFAMNAVSDKIGAHIVGKLAQNGIVPTSAFGRNAMQFTANLIGTIPEDILQTSVDNVLTYNIKDNTALFDPTQMTENFKNNLIFMAGLNALRAGRSAVKRARLAKQIAKAADLDEELVIGKFADADDIARAASKGQEIKVDGEKVSTVDVDGNETVLKNTTPEEANIAMRTLDDTSTSNYSRIGIAEQRNALDSISPELQSAWYENGDRNAREAIADIIESDPTVRNASLNKFYEDYLYWQRALDHRPLSFDEWLDSDIVLYRYSDPEMDSGLRTLSYSVAPGGLPIMGGDVQMIVVKPIDTLGRAQLTGTAAENEVFVRRDIADKKAPGVGTYEYAVMEGDILKNKDSSRTAAKRAMTTRDIDVWSSKNLKDGDRVYTSSSEADADFGHNNVTKHTIQLSDAEWDDVNHGVYKSQMDATKIADAQQTVRPQEESREVFYHGVGDGSETGDTHGSGLYLTNDEGRAGYYSKTGAPVEKYKIDNLNIFDLSNKLPDDIIEYLKKSAAEDAGTNEMLLPLSTKTEVFSLDEVVDAKKTMEARMEEWKGHNGDERTRPTLSRGNNGSFVITSVDYTLGGLSRVTGEQLFQRLPSPIAQQIFTANGYNGVKYRAIGGDTEAVIYNGEATRTNGGDTSGTGARPEVVKTEEAIEPVKKKTRKEWKENPTYDQDYSLRRAEDVMEGRTTLDDYLEEQKERMWEALKNSNEGTETFYHRDETGQIDGRNTVSYNGTLYRQLYEEYGGRPTKAEFGEAFDDVVKNGENSKYYEGFKEFDAEGDYSRGYNAGNEEVDTILALKEDVESTPAKATENAPGIEPEAGAARTEVEEPRVETETTRVETEEPKTATGAGTAVGETLGEAPDIRVRNVDDGLKMRISPTPPNVRALHTQTLGAAMRDFSQIHLPEFQRRFPGVEVSDFDWVFHNTRNGLEPNQIVGMIDPETGREVTDQMIEAMQWFGDQPFMKDLRKASRDALGLEGDFNMLGYLPHSTYDPSNLSFDEALTGRLWQQYTGASMIGENGQYKGFGGDFNSRYRTFASNMLWDARNKDVAAAKVMEEAAMDGKTITPEQAAKVVDGQRSLLKEVDDASSTKAKEDALVSDADTSEIDFKKIDEATKKQAENSRIGESIHDNWADAFFGANSATVAKQSGATRQAFDTLGNTMRNTQIIDGRGRRMSLYDWGGADFVYAERNAIELVNRYMREGGDLRDMLIEFIENHSHRTTEYAEAVADRWMGKLGDTPGRLTKARAISSLSGSMKWEAMGRIRKFLVMAKYDEFNAATKKTIDSFLFGHMQMDTIKTSQKIGKKLSSALNAMTSMRYRALFYGNVKNALLQTSELNRLFTTFKWGDVATMAKRMATDANFKARVDDIYDAVAPQQSSFRSALYDDYAEVAGDMKTTQDGVSLKDGGKRMVEAVDNIGLAPIEAAEAFKNRMMVAALVQEADSLGLTGDDALRHIRGRFERVALAMDELGRIGMASNPIARTALFLQNFQIRELGMHIYNLSDEWAKGTKLPSKILNASKYLSKVLGTKLATTLILARLGYSSSQTLGYDPFGVLEDYTGMNEEDLEGFDYFMKSPLFAGGMTSLLSDMYFMARKAYEESNPKTISEEAEENISGESSWGLEGLSFDDLMGLGQNFVPGNVFFNRINQMNEMMDTGWATSVSGNKMYTAPSDALNTILGYLFGRSATQNAQQYNQTYGDNLLQTLGRMRPGRGFGEFDPIDSKNYSDWFKGDGNDRQQFEKGRRYFQQQRDRILDEYEDAIRKSYASNDDIAEAKNNMNQSLEDLYTQLDRFVDAYEKKNGTIDSAMTKQIINLLNTGRDVLGDTPEQAQERSLEEYNKALERYSQRGYSPVGTYTGPSESQPNKEVKYQGSPQYRTAVSGKYTLNSEAVAVLKEADKVLSDVRKELKQVVSDAYDTKDYDKLAEVQKQYLTLFDKAVAPVIATYGNGILSSTDVVNQLKDMLSTGTVSRSGDLIPSDQYRKDKYGRYRSMPLETVDVKKWAQQRYSGDIYKQPTVRSYTAAGDDIMEIRRLINQGKSDRARARALQLKVRVDNQKRTISQEDYSWLLDFLNNTGE